MQNNCHSIRIKEIKSFWKNLSTFSISNSIVTKRTQKNPTKPKEKKQEKNLHSIEISWILITTCQFRKYMQNNPEFHDDKFLQFSHTRMKM